MKKKAKEKRIKHWALKWKLLFWVASPVLFTIVSFSFLYAMMTFLSSMGTKSNLLAPVAAGTMGFCYFVLLYLVERPFVRYERMRWWQYVVGAYGLGGLFQLILWLLCRNVYLEDKANEDFEFFTFLFLTMTIYTGIALLFRLSEAGLEYLIRRHYQKKNREKLERYRKLQEKSGKITDTSAVFKNEE